MNDPARGQLEKDIEKAQRDLQFAQQDAQTEVTDLTKQLQGDFQEKLNPVIEQLRVDKGPADDLQRPRLRCRRGRARPRPVGRESSSGSTRQREDSGHRTGARRCTAGNDS